MTPGQFWYWFGNDKDGDTCVPAGTKRPGIPDKTGAELDQEAEAIKEAIRVLTERHPERNGKFDLFNEVMPIVEGMNNG